MSTIANTIDIYVGEESNDHFDLDSLAALYNCKVVSDNGEYAEIEGDPNDLDQFAEFWAQSTLDI